MQMASFVEALQSDLEEIAAVGDEATAAAAQRLAAALKASAGLRVLDALTEAALELNGQLPEGHVEVRLAGQDPSLVYVEDARQRAGQPAEGLRPLLKGGSMTFYPLQFGHVELRIDERPPRRTPPPLARRGGRR